MRTLIVPLVALSIALAAPQAGEAAKKKAAQTKGKAPVVELQTSMGNIRIELYPQKAPNTVKNFVTYVKAGHYKGTVFHRVIDGFMIQGGGFTPDFKEKSTRAPIQNEADNGLKNERGTVAMARTSDPHSASAQFFINVADNAFLNHTSKTPRGWGYTVFGKVVKGMDVVDKIKSVKTGARGPFGRDVPATDIVIRKARVL